MIQPIAMTVNDRRQAPAPRPGDSMAPARLAVSMTPVHYLRPLLAPSSVALVGASERAGSLGRIVYENLLAGGFRGEIAAVNPNHATVLGRPAHPSMAAIGLVDAAVICA